MAVVLKTVFPNRVDSSDPNYPWGKGINQQEGVVDSGTPIDATWFNDIEGGKQALIYLAGIVPSGQSDNAKNSDAAEAVKRISKAQSVGNLKGSFRYGFTYSEEGDVGIDNDGKIYTYVGSDPLPVNVAPETNPAGDSDYRAFYFPYRSYNSIEEVLSDRSIVNLIGRVIETESYYAGLGYGGAKYRVNSALEIDAAKIAAGIQIETTTTDITIELLEPNDKFVEQIGVVRSSAQDATTIMQPYIDYFKSIGDSLTLRLARWTYYLHTELDLLNIGNNNSIAIIGQGKTRINSQGTGSILYANTGRIGILVAGTENVKFEGFSIFADPNNATLTTPSNIGLMFARTDTFNYCQFIKLNDIHVSVYSNDLTDNENRGGIGVYNYASESWDSDGLSIAADTPAVFTTSNVLNVNYTDRFINPSLSTFTTTNFQFDNLQLYPKGGSACLMDVVRDFEVNTLLGFADALQSKYLFEFEGDLPCRRIYVNNIHTERLGRFIRVGTPLLESKFSGKAGASNSDSGILVADDGYLNNVDFDVFFFSSGTVKIIDDRTSNESFGVTISHSKLTNGPNVSFEFDMGTATYANTTINSDSNVDTIHGVITAPSDSTIYIYGRDGLRTFGDNFRGFVRPTTGLYDGREFYDMALKKPIWYHGGQWVVGFAFSATTAELQDATSAINTTDKFKYKQVTNEDTLQQVYAAATSPTSTWRDSDGNIVYTPV